jgi:hypothetical protein
MTFSERMKALLEQGAQVSKQYASKAGERAQDLGARGFKASKEFAAKAGEKAQTMGERGVLMLEIRQLESFAQKSMTRLGNEVYFAFDKGSTSVSSDSPAIKAILDEIAKTRASIEQRETELASKK